MMIIIIRFWWYNTLTFGFDSYFRIFIDNKIAYNLKTTGHILTQFYTVMMHRTWFSKKNKSGQIWPWIKFDLASRTKLHKFLVGSFLVCFARTHTDKQTHGRH